MTLLEINALYCEALPAGAAFGGHPTQTAAAVAMFNNWPALKAAIIAASMAQPSFTPEGDAA